MRRGNQVVVEGDDAEFGKVYASVEEVVGSKSYLLDQSAPLCEMSWPLPLKTYLVEGHARYRKVIHSIHAVRQGVAY